jgi:hypothetical protein
MWSRLPRLSTTVEGILMANSASGNCFKGHSRDDTRGFNTWIPNVDRLSSSGDSPDEVGTKQLSKENTENTTIGHLNEERISSIK